MGLPPEVVPAIFETDDGTLMMTVGTVYTDEGPGYYDRVFTFCPFCGTKLAAASEDKKGVQ